MVQKPENPNRNQKIVLKKFNKVSKYIYKKITNKSKHISFHIKQGHLLIFTMHNCKINSEIMIKKYIKITFSIHRTSKHRKLRVTPFLHPDLRFVHQVYRAYSYRVKGQND